METSISPIQSTTTTSSGATVPTFRVDRPDLTYRDPVLDRWGTSVIDNVVHRCATLDYSTVTTASSAYGLISLDDGTAFRDEHARCGGAPFIRDTTDVRPTSDVGCPVCLSLDGPPRFFTADEQTALVGAVSDMLDAAAAATGVVLDVDRNDVADVVAEHVPVLDVDAPCYLRDAPPFTIGSDSTADIERGRQTVNDYRYGTVRRPSVWSAVTLSDVVAYWQSRHAAYWADMNHVGRTVRSMARSRGWEYQYDRYMPRAIDRVDVPTVIRPVIERRTTIDAANGAIDVDAVTGFRPVAPPTSVLDVGHGATMVDVCAAVIVLENGSRIALDAVADVLLDAANDNDWCHEYEQSVNRLNDGLSSYATRGYDNGGPFIEREREHDYVVSGTVQITVDVPWSTVVTASSESDAVDYVDTDSIDVDDAVYDMARRIADASYRERRYMYNVGDIDIDTAELA